VLQGGSAADRFEVQTATAADLSGGDGDDQVAFSDQAVLSGSIDGQGGSDTLDVSAYTTAVTFNLQAAMATPLTGTFAGVEQVVGGGAADVLVGPRRRHHLEPHRYRHG